MKIVIMTNNNLVYEKYKDDYEVELHEDLSILELLRKVKFKIHDGHKLLTHPLATSVKPNETLYKSVVISKDAPGLDFESSNIIDKSILTCEKFAKIKYHLVYTDIIKDDFKEIDFTSIQSALESMNVTIGNF